MTASELPTCCNHVATTPFCPYCGKGLLPSGPLGELLAHCRRVARTASVRERRDRQRQEAAKQAGKPTTWYAEAIESAARTSAKWLRWSDALAAAIQQLSKGKER